MMMGLEYSRIPLCGDGGYSHGIRFARGRLFLGLTLSRHGIMIAWGFDVSGGLTFRSWHWS